MLGIVKVRTYGRKSSTATLTLFYIRSSSTLLLLLLSLFFSPNVHPVGRYYKIGASSMNENYYRACNDIARATTYIYDVGLCRRRVCSIGWDCVEYCRYGPLLRVQIQFRKVGRLSAMSVFQMFTKQYSIIVIIFFIIIVELVFHHMGLTS
jgi:hypothetical protein